MTDPDPEHLLATARRFVESIPYARLTGMVVEELAPGLAALSMPYDAQLVGDPVTGVLHGGAVFALMDTASGTAVMSRPEAPLRTATLDLRVDYMRPATPGQRITARAECHHVTRTVAFVRVTATDDDEARPVATATGAFTFDRGGADGG